MRAAALGLVALYAGVTMYRNLSWSDPLIFYATQVEDSPRSAKAHYNYGSQLAQDGHDADAIAQYRIALDIFPYYPEAFFNLGNALRRQQAPADQVIDAYRSAIRFDPGHQGALGNLLLYLLEHKRLAEAGQIATKLAKVNLRHPALMQFAQAVSALPR